jgi:hypothetical protein
MAKVKNTPVYVAAVVLNPRLKWTYLHPQEEHNSRAQLDRAGRMVRSLWATDYKTSPPDLNLDGSENTEQPHSFFGKWLIQSAVTKVPSSTTIPGSTSNPTQRSTMPRGRPRREGNRQPLGPSPPLVEYDSLNLEPRDLRVKDVFGFWRNKRTIYPELSSMAVELLSIDAM